MTSGYLSAAEIARWQPFPPPAPGDAALAITRRRLERAGQWAPWQMMGRRMAIGCVALEITQRCNLDCTYCYLSESSEALKDIPIEEVYRRIDLIKAHYGAGTDVQVTGGDPTLRRRDELIAIVRYIRAQGMSASLFTNGIRATRELLAELSAAGLEDVAFHVDMTQRRKGYRSEVELNAIRADYIERARGLPLAVFFNTTVFPENFHEVPELVKFFVRHSDVVRLVSFQVGADSGRGTERARVTVSPLTVRQAIFAGTGTQLDFDVATAGHRDCNGYAYGLVINNRVYDFFVDSDFARHVLDRASGVKVDRANLSAMWVKVVGFLLANPRICWGVVWRFAGILWRARRDLLAARGRIRKLSFFVHNFMDSSELVRERCESCAFMVMTPAGPMSMCVHNAKRDAYLLVPATIERANRVRYFNPVTGKLQDDMPARIQVSLSRKNARGRARQTLRSGISAATRAQPGEEGLHE